MVVLLPACTASGGDPDGGTPDPTAAALVCPAGTRPGGAPLVAPSSDATAPPPEPDAPAPPSAEVLDIGAFLPRTGDYNRE